jgi:hypothetical protein
MHPMARRIIAIGALVLVFGFFVVSVVIFIFALRSSKPGEIAGAFGSIVGGMIGASGAAGAVYLTLSAYSSVRHYVAKRRSSAPRYPHCAWYLGETS